MKTSIFRPGNFRAYWRKVRRDPNWFTLAWFTLAWFILVPAGGLGECNLEGCIALIFDECGGGKVSFPAQLSVK
jgi:hypothetical protein